MIALQSLWPQPSKGDARAKHRDGDMAKCQTPGKMRRTAGRIQYPAHYDRSDKTAALPQHGMHCQGRASAIGIGAASRPGRQR